MGTVAPGLSCAGCERSRGLPARPLLPSSGHGMLSLFCGLCGACLVQAVLSACEDAGPSGVYTWGAPSQMPLAGSYLSLVT